MQNSITLPYLRTTPLHIPRRDLVLSASDSLLLTVVVVESDNPSAQALVLSTDADGPSMQLVLWDDTAWNGSRRYYGGNYWGGGQLLLSGYVGDYGWGSWGRGTILQSISGVPGGALGSWDFAVPTGTFYNFPLRCGWAVLLLWNAGAKSSVLGQGIATFMRPYFQGVPLSAIPPPIPPVIIPPAAPAFLSLTTDTNTPIITSDTTGANAALQLETS
jgi:hypothetical protein